MENISIEQVINQIKVSEEKFHKALMTSAGSDLLIHLKKNIEYWKEVKAGFLSNTNYRQAS